MVKRETGGLMSRDEGEFWDIDDIENYYSRQEQVHAELPTGILWNIIEIVYENISKFFYLLHTAEDRVVFHPEGRAELTMHKDLRMKIFKALCVLEYILRLDFFQKVYGMVWNQEIDGQSSDEAWHEKPWKVELPEEDFINVLRPLEIILERLIAFDGIIEHPPEVHRFLKKYRAAGTEEYWEKQKKKLLERYNDSEIKK